MKRTTILLALALAALALAAPLAAEGSASKASGAAAAAGSAAGAAQAAVTLDQARAGAQARSRSLQKALLGADAAKLASAARKYEMLPSLSASAQAGLSYDEGTDPLSTFKASLGLSASQTLFDGGRNAALAAIDAIDEAVAREAARSAYLAAAADAESAFFSALEARAAEEAARSDLEAARLHLEIAAAQLEAGMIARPAYLKVESEAATKETALNQARMASTTASRKLSSLTGVPAGAALSEEGLAELEALASRVGALSEERTESFASALLAAAASGNPDLAQSSLATARAEGEVSYARKAGLPTFSASWSHAASYAEEPGLELGGGSVSLSASLSLEPWAVRNSVAQKRAAASQAALDEEESRSTLELDLRSAVYEAVANARAIASSRKALEYAEGNYESQLEAFKLSSLSSSDLSDAEVLVGSARSSLISARYSFLAGLSELRSLAGLEDQARLAAALP